MMDDGWLYSDNVQNGCGQKKLQRPPGRSNVPPFTFPLARVLCVRQAHSPSRKRAVRIGHSPEGRNQLVPPLATLPLACVSPRAIPSTPPRAAGCR